MSQLLQEPLGSRIRLRLTKAVSALLRTALGRSEHPGYAEDIVAEALNAAYQKRELYDPRSGGLYPWLLQIARNRARDFVRSHGELRREQSLDESGLSPASLNPLQDAQESDSVGPRISALRRALARLRRYDRELLIGRLGSALGYDELEQYLGLSARRSTLRVHVRRARMRLRRELAKEPVFRDLLDDR